MKTKILSLLFLVSLTVNAAPVSVNFTFTTDGNAQHWIAGANVNNANPASHTVSNGHFNATMGNTNTSGGTAYRADLKYNATFNNTAGSATNNLTLDPTEDVYIAVKFIGSRPAGNFKMEVRRDNNGTLSWFNTSYGQSGNNPEGTSANRPHGTIRTKNDNEICYFRLTADVGYAGLSEVQVRQINIIIADCAVAPYSYTVDWVATFATLEDLEAYKNYQDDGPDDLDEYTPPAPVQRFVHPGLSHKQSDLDRMKAMVAAKIEPWYTSYRNLLNVAQAKYTYSVRGSKTFTTVTQDGTNYSAIMSDVKAAYLNAIMWAITGDTRHAEKAVEILNAWQNLTCYTGGGTEALNAGRQAWQFIEAAEIMKSTYSGWAAEDIQKFKDMLVYPGYSNTAVPPSLTNDNGTFYWRVYNGDPGRHGNQDLFGWRTVMSMGIFLDNEIMYDRAYRYFTGQTHRDDDLPYPSGPPNASASPSATNEYFDTYTVSSRGTSIPDYGYDGVLQNYIWETGQGQESSRDQDHALLGVGMVASMAEMAWNQGDTVYSMLDSRIRKGFEWALRYNVSWSYSFSDQLTPWEPTVESGEFMQGRDRSGRWFSKKVNPHSESDFVGVTRGKFQSSMRPIYEMAMAHYGIRAGSNPDSIKWTKRALDISNGEDGYEQQPPTGQSLDHLGWGGLTFHRTEWMAGDPVSYASGNKVFALPTVPCSINAVDFDFFAGNGQGRTHNDLSEGNAGNVYRTDAGVDIKDGDNDYVIYDMQNGEWLSYTVAFPRNGAFEILIRHKTTEAGAKLLFAVDNKESFEVELPVSNNFIETSLKIDLTEGCKVIRIYVIGTNDATELSSIKFDFDETAAPDIQMEGYLSANKAAELTWKYWNCNPANLTLYRGTSSDFQQATVIEPDITASAYTDPTIISTENQYHYWISAEVNGQTIVSNEVVLSWGYFFDKFDDPDKVVWNVTSGSTGYESNNMLNIICSNNNAAIAGRTGGVILHAGNYPILALKIALPDQTSIAIHNATSSILGGGTDSYSGVLNDSVYYYDMTQLGFVRNGTTTMVPTDDILQNAAFQLRLASSSAQTAQLEWIGTFISLEDLKEFLGISDILPLAATAVTTATGSFAFTIGVVNNNTKIQVDWGDGVLVPFTIAVGASIQSITGTLAGDTVRIYGESIYHLDFSKSSLTDVDITQASDLTSFNCSVNQLSNLDVSQNTQLEELNCEDNQFVFSNLPLLSIATYVYAPQDTIRDNTVEWDTMIDLSSEALINGESTVYTWFYISESNETAITTGITTVAGGKFTFNKSLAGKTLRCKMTNVTFPALTLVYEVKLKQVDPETIMLVNVLSSIQVAYGTPVGALNLPAQVNVTLSDQTIIAVSVNWNTSFYDAYSPGVYSMPGILINLPTGVINPGNLMANIKVQVENPPVTIDPVQITRQPTGDLICERGSILLRIEASGTDPEYQWYFNGNEIAGAQTSSYWINSVNADNSGAYSVRVSNSISSETSDPAEVRMVARIQTPILLTLPEIIYRNREVRLHVGPESGYEDVSGYSWYFDEPNGDLSIHNTSAFDLAVTFRTATERQTIRVDIEHYCGSYSVEKTVTVAVSTSIENAEATTLNVYPNPVSDVLNIENVQSAIMQVRITDLSGRLILVAKPEANTWQCPVTGWQSGMYILTVQTKNGTSRHKVMKN